MPRAWENAARTSPVSSFPWDAAGFTLLVVSFLATVLRTDADQFIPACCLAGGLITSVITVSRISQKSKSVMLGGLGGSLGLFVAVKIGEMVLLRLPFVEMPRQFFALPRVMPGALVFGIQGLLIGAAVSTMLETARQLRLPYYVLILVVWGLFFVAYLYWLRYVNQ
jgi:hypothetical protein